MGGMPSGLALYFSDRHSVERLRNWKAAIPGIESYKAIGKEKCFIDNLSFLLEKKNWLMLKGVRQIIVKFSTRWASPMSQSKKVYLVPNPACFGLLLFNAVSLILDFLAG